MATENPMRTADSNRGGKWVPASFASPGSSIVVNDELGLLLRGHNIHRDQRNIAPNRSGSAPPSVEGSVAAFDQLLADASYSTFYPSNINVNPRFSPPTISRESVPFVHQGGISGNNWRLTSLDGHGSGYMPRVSLSTHEEEPEDDSPPKGASDDVAEINVGQNTLSFTGCHRSLVDLIQEDFPRTPSPIFSQTLSSSHVEEKLNHEAGNLSLDSLSLKASKPPEPKSEIGCGDATETSPDSIAKQDPKVGSDSLAPQKDETTNEQGVSIHVDASKKHHKAEEHQDKQISISEQNVLHPQSYPVPGYQMQGTGQGANNNSMDNLPHSHLKMTSVEIQPLLHSPPLYATPPAAYMASGNSFYPNFNASGLYAPQYSGYALGSSYLPPYLSGYQTPTGFAIQFNANSGQSFSGHQSAAESISKGPIMQNADRFYGHHALPMHPTVPDPLPMQYFQQLVQDPYSAQAPFGRFLPPGMIGSQVDSFALRNDQSAPAYTGDQKFQLPFGGSLSIPSPRNIGSPSSSYLSSPTGLGFVPQSPLGSPVLPGSPISGTGRRYDVGFSQSSPRNVGGYGRWQGQRGTDNIGDYRKHTFLEELKTSGAQRIDLSDVYGRIVEFSIDQHGSRFIQQKLENCSAEDKDAVFNEVLPHAPKLITDVFGNYVIQKFFEHGTYQQRKELASQLSGHMLPLSLQMYGCRVIQKALEAIELDQKTQLVHELDGHVMRCVRDQNGNHVIQKCIECLPVENIDFIISEFEGHVAMLSTHPYGCRVIQRVLEHCSDDVQCRSLVDEILESAYDLAQDQYGNYVIQHVLERGKPFERSKIISKLSGKVVLMSQHKYASNVVEKCLEYGDAAEREVLIEEILVQSEDNDSLLVMMKDQFANYVVQKILEISCDRQREILLDRIQIHLDALKKYTYGKHIVARFEQLTGEGSGASD